MYTTKMNLDGQVSDYVGCPPSALVNPDAFGVEVELEGAHVAEAKALVLEYWAAHPDHSLRNHYGQSIEYVFHKPYHLKKTTTAIDLLFDFLNTPPVKVHESYRTSIHVHVNFAAETLRTVYNFITLSIILDELMVSQNGDHRIGNNFCLRARDAYGQITSLVGSITSGNEICGISQNERYSSINFASLNKFGSIEFRSLECTTHKGRLMHWINTLDHMKKMSKGFTNPQEIIGLFSQMGAQEFLFKILGPYAIKYSQVPGMSDMLRNGMRIAQDFAYCSEWNVRKLDENSPKFKIKPLKPKVQFGHMPQGYQVGQADGALANYVNGLGQHAAPVDWAGWNFGDQPANDQPPMHNLDEEEQAG